MISDIVISKAGTSRCKLGFESELGISSPTISLLIGNFETAERLYPYNKYPIKYII